MVWTSPRTWVAGEVPTAAIFNTHVRDNLKAIGDAWTSYSPTLGGWTLGNGTLTGYYLQAGKDVRGKVFYTVGSTDTKSGALTISLPVTKVTDSGLGMPLGTAVLFDTSTSTRNFQHVAQNSTTAMRFYSSAGAALTDTAPWTWATGDTLVALFMYEAA